MTYSRSALYGIPKTRWVGTTQDGLFPGFTATAGGPNPVVNQAQYMPLPSVPVDATATSLKFWATTGTSAGRNYDIGWYNSSFVKLSSSGATLVAAGLNTWTYSQPLTAGALYYVGISFNHASLGILGPTVAYGSLIGQRVAGFGQEASAHPLPATATFVQPTLVAMYIVVATFA